MFLEKLIHSNILYIYRLDENQTKKKTIYANKIVFIYTGCFTSAYQYFYGRFFGSRREKSVWGLFWNSADSA